MGLCFCVFLIILLIIILYINNNNSNNQAFGVFPPSLQKTTFCGASCCNGIGQKENYFGQEKSSREDAKMFARQQQGASIMQGSGMGEMDLQYMVYQ